LHARPTPFVPEIENPYRRHVAGELTCCYLKGHLMPTGTVKWFNSQKGFGFIAPDQGGPDAFVHISAVERAGLRDLKEGQKLDFELVSDRKSGKMSADNLKVHS
jgi:CspA family cold shock protein